MSGSLVLFLLLIAGLAGGKEPELQATESTVFDEPRFSCFASQYRRLSSDCTPKQKVCYYTRRMPRFASDFRPNDLIGRGCDIPRNTHPDSCHEYTKGLDTFVRCECGTADCNSHYWHGFAIAAFHHRKLLKAERARREKEGGGEEQERYADWFMTCFKLMALLWVFHFVVDLIKKYRFHKRAVLMRSVLVARGTQQAEAVQWNLDKPEVTIHNFKTSFVKLIDGFIRYRSLGSLPPVDIKQLHATWLLGRQDLHRLPTWFSKKLGDNEVLNKQAHIYNEASVEVARVGHESLFDVMMIREEMELIKREKKADRKKRKSGIRSSEKQTNRESDVEEQSSSRKFTRNDENAVHDRMM